MDKVGKLNSIRSCDAPNPGGHLFFFFFGYWTSLSRQRISIATEVLCRVHVLVVCAPRALSLRLSRSCIPVTRACLSCALNSVVGNRVSLSCAARHLCSTRCVPIVHAVRLSCELCACRAHCAPVVRAVRLSCALCARRARCAPIVRYAPGLICHVRLA